MLCLLLFPLAVMAQAPSFPVRLDLQSQSRTFALKWAAGSSPILSAYVSDGGRAYTNLSGWTGYVYVAVTPTAGVYVAASPVASNRVNFSFTASQTATVGTFNVEVVLGNGTNTYRWGTGSLALSNSPALLGAGTVPLTGIFNWDLYTFTGTQPPLSASYTNPLAGDVTGVPGATVIADDVVGTNNLDAEVRGLWFPYSIGSYSTNRLHAVETNYISGAAASNSFVKQNGDILTGGLDFTNGAPARFMNGAQAYWYYTGPGGYPVILIDAENGGAYGTSNAVISIIRNTGQILYIGASTNNNGNKLVPISRAHGNSAIATNWVDIWDGGNLPDPRNLSSGTNAPPAWTNSGNAETLSGYLPTDFVLLTTLSTGGYLRITSGAVTSNSMPGTRGEYRRTTTNAYFHDGSQWVTWSVSTNFSH